MASRQDVLTEGRAFRDALDLLANKSGFSQPERDGFRRLRDMYGARLTGFELRPLYGDDSPYYENALFWANLGKTHAPSCTPGDSAMQQMLYDAANRGGDALDAITASHAVLGALLLKRSAAIPAVLPPPVAKRGAEAQPVADTPPGPTPPPKQPELFAKLTAMFPAEAITLYMAGAQVHNFDRLVVLLVILAAMLAVRWQANRPAPPNYAMLGVAAASFMLWVFGTADDALITSINHWFGGIFGTIPAASVPTIQSVACFLIPVWTWVIPYFVKMEPPPQP